MDETKETSKEEPKETAPLDDGFNSEDHGDHWHLFCKTCGQGWSITKPLPFTELARLMDHAAQHAPAN